MTTLRDIQRALYLVQRATGDVRSAQKGTLPKRLVRRAVTRRLMRPYDRAWRKL